MWSGNSSLTTLLTWNCSCQRRVAVNISVAAVGLRFLNVIKGTWKPVRGFYTRQETLRNNYRTHEIRQREIETKLYWKKRRENDGVWLRREECVSMCTTSNI